VSYAARLNAKSAFSEFDFDTFDTDCRVLFPVNVETPKLKIENSFPEIDCRATELLLKKLKILGPSEKPSKKFHI
jgi:hypothetical protein